jgi:glycosyltransferase involved in cell wall biosynthesis
MEKYGLPDKFLFYPAQFWLHKNHKGLVDALHLLKKERGIEVPVVFVGSKKNAHKELSRRISELGLSKQVFYLGYVPDEEMVGLYRSAFALVMPTFFGPTNIPQLEAFLLGCPVITSRLPGIDEQVGDAAILIDPYSAGSIAEGISRIWENETLREELVLKGYRRSMLWPQEDFNVAFRKILDNAFSSLKGA